MLSIIAVVLAALALLGVAGLVVRGGRAGARVR
jgi:hypothetical protein